jgi:hypothetical protein
MIFVWVIGYLLVIGMAEKKDVLTCATLGLILWPMFLGMLIKDLK